MADDILTESYDFLQKAVGEFAKLVTALADTLGQDEIRRLILADLGLDPDTGAQLVLPQQNTDSIQAYLERTDTDVEAFLVVVDDISQVIQAVTSFIDAASADPTTEDGLRELAFELFMLSSLLQYRYRHPAALALAEMLGVINYGLEDYELTRLVVDQLYRLGRALIDVSISLHTLFFWKLDKVTDLQTESDARDISDVILLPAAGLLSYFFDLKETPTSWLDTELLYGWDILDTDNPTPAEIISDRILSTQFNAEKKDSPQKLFSLGQDFTAELDNRVVSTALQNDFLSNGHGFSTPAVVVVKEPGKKWILVAANRFTIKKEESALNVYGERAINELSLALGVALVPKDDGGPGIFLGLGAAAERTIPLAHNWSLEVKSKAAATLFLNFADITDPQTFGPPDAGLSVVAKKKDKYLQRRAELPDAQGITLSFGSSELGFELTTNKLEQRVVTKNNTLVITSKNADSFIRKSLPAGEIRADFDVGLAFDFIRGQLRFTEGTRLKVVLPLGKEVLGVRFVFITLEVAPVTDDSGTRVRIEISGSLSIKWGPFTSAIDRIGLIATLPPPKSASGDRDWSEAFSFKPPTGVGFAIETAAVTGGGFLFYDRDNKEYAGVIQLAIVEKFDIKAIALITTKLPGGEEGFSMIALASVEFSPGYQLIWGFTLEGVGLLVGVNRSMVLEALRTGVRTGTLDSILFPDDPVRNAPKIINDLSNVFQPTPDRHVFGFMLFLSWGGLKNSFKIKLGVILELPTPVKLVIVGQLEITLPGKQVGIVLIQCDIVGIWDQAEKTIIVDAALRDSKVGEFPMTGEMAVRGSWGERKRKVFIVAAGGVHPAFNPPAELPTLKRVQIAVGSGDNPRLRLEGYLAITSNTFQVGARAELYASASGFTLEGWAGVDALFQFDPFKVVVDFSAGVKIKRGSRVLFSLTLNATLEAFSPIRIRGKVKFKIFFVKFSIPVNLELGSPREAVLATVDVLEELIDAFEDSNNWTGELPGRRQSIVSLQQTSPSGELKVHPLGALSVRQQVVPLDIEIQVYKNTRPSGERRFEITALEVNGEPISRSLVQEFFAPAQFFEMSDDEKLSRPSFEELPAGVMAGDDTITHGAAVASVITYETIRIDRGQGRLIRLGDYNLNQEVYEAVAAFGSASQEPSQSTGAGKYRLPGLGVQVAEPAYGIAGVDDLTEVEGITAGGSYSQVLADLHAHQAEHPKEAGRLQVVGLHERVTT